MLGDGDGRSEPVRIGWIGPPELATAVAAAGDGSTTLVPVGGALPDEAGIVALLIDTTTVGGVEAVLELRSRLPAMVVVRCHPTELPALLPGLRDGDGVALGDEPPALVHFRLVAAARGAHPRRDALTGLATRLAFKDAVMAAPARWSGPVSAIMVDIDHFKGVNDRHGHPFGDRVLREVARRTFHHSPPEALVARHGGEEFAVLLAADADAARRLSDDLLRAIRADPIDGETVTASAGAATIDAGAAGLGEALIGRADEALIAAKARGRDRAVHWDDLRLEAIAENRDPAISAFENRTRVMGERLFEQIAVRGRRLFGQLRREADHDALTGLYGRRYLDRRLPAEHQAARDGGIPVTVALLDVDFFGEVNKAHGLPTGDRVLAEIAARIGRSVRAGDWVARYGGDEVCVVMRGVDREQARAILERIRETVAAEPVRSTSGLPLALTVSIGAAELEPEEGVQALLERASARLLEAKRSGRNQVRL